MVCPQPFHRYANFTYIGHPEICRTGQPAVQAGRHAGRQAATQLGTCFPSSLSLPCPGPVKVLAKRAAAAAVQLDARGELAQSSALAPTASPNVNPCVLCRSEPLIREK